MTTQNNRLAELRTRAKLTQEEVASILGVTIAIVSRHEVGTRKMSHEAVLRYARIYKVYTYEIFTTLTSTNRRKEWEDGDPPPVEEESAFTT